MKVVILAGGFGTRLSEETGVRPKPMVEIGGRPIIWHIMSHYARFGLNDFVICAGYKADFIRNYFLNYYRSCSDFTVDLSSGAVTTLRSTAEDWRVTVLDTGLETMTGGRIKRAGAVVGNERFCLTYGDGVSNVDVNKLIAHHEAHDAFATLTAVRMPGRFGALDLTPDGSRVRGFREKGATDGGLINGGFFVCEPDVFDMIGGDDTVWENGPISRITEAGKLASYHHPGYWQNMDTLRDRELLEALWKKGNAPWTALERDAVDA